MLISKIGAMRLAFACVGLATLGAVSAYALNQGGGLSDAALAALETAGDGSPHEIMRWF